MAAAVAVASGVVIAVALAEVRAYAAAAMRWITPCTSRADASTHP